MWWVGRITGCDPPAIHRNRCSNGPDERTLQGYGRPLDRATAGLPDRPQRPAGLADPTPTDRLGDRPGAWECSPLIRSSCCSSSWRSVRPSAACGSAESAWAQRRRCSPGSACPRSIRIWRSSRRSSRCSGSRCSSTRSDWPPARRSSAGCARTACGSASQLRCCSARSGSPSPGSVSCSTSIQAPGRDSSPGRRRTLRHCQLRSSSSRRRSRRTRSPTRSSATRSCIPSAWWR